ncbi:MAG: ABC transporter ATP-binding protein [Pseudomonadota bacterium]
MFRFFENAINPYPDESPERPPEGFVAFCWHYTKDIWPWVALMAGLAALIGIGQAVMFAFLGSLVDWLATQERETFLADNGWSLALMGLFVLVILPVFGTLQTLIMHQTLAGNYPMIVRWQAHRYLLGQSASFFADEFAGRVATKVMQTALAVRETVMKLFDILVFTASFFLGVLVVTAAADWRLMAPLAIWAVAYGTLLRIMVPRLANVSRQQADARSTMTGRVVDSYTNISIVKLFSHARREQGYAREAMQEFMGTVHHQMRLVTVLNVLIDMLNVLLLFAVSAMAIWLWLNEAITLGAIAVAIGLVLRLEGFSYWIMWEIAALFENIGVVMDGKGMLSKSRSVQDVPDAKPLTVTEGKIAFENIRFHYGKEGGVIDDLTLHVAPGEKIGLVGRSGAGKTTLMNLLLRLHDLEAGRVTIDGQDISRVTQDSLREHIGVVTQDTSLLHRSVRDNIVYGRPDASDEEVRKAIERARADMFIRDLVDGEGRIGLDAHVGERGVKLSGGQRQRIAIARVFLKDAPILLLDEATSALDSEVEAAIQDSLFGLMEGKTVIAIAHRLSTIAALDRLIVMDKGEIIEEGSHEALIARDGLYARLWKHQSGGFIESVTQVAAE